MDKAKEDISDGEILKLWRDVNFSGSYRGVQTFQVLLKTDLNIHISSKRLYNILKKDPIFLLHLKPQRNFPRRKFDLSYYGQLIQSDVGFMFENEGFKYFLVLIDCYSHKIFVSALKNKSSETVLSEFKKGLKSLDTEVAAVETDQGTEYALVKKYCLNSKIRFKYKFGKNKARYKMILAHYNNN